MNIPYLVTTSQSCNLFQSSQAFVLMVGIFRHFKPGHWLVLVANYFKLVLLLQRNLGGPLLLLGSFPVSKTPELARSKRDIIRGPELPHLLVFAAPMT